MQSQLKPKNELFSGLTFSLSDIDLDNSGLDLVPISLDTSIDESNDKDKECLNEPHEDVTSSQSEHNSLNFNTCDIFPPLPMENINRNTYQDPNINETTPGFTLNNEIRIIEGQSVPGTMNNANYYEPAIWYWFFQDEQNTWKPFSLIDSERLEARHLCLLDNERRYDVDDCVAVEGGRYDVYIKERLRKSVFWSECDKLVRRVSWLYREEEGRSHEPYNEMECALLEAKYFEVLKHNLWQQWLPLTDLKNQDQIENYIVFHTAHTISQYRRFQNEESLRARVVYRGLSSIYHMLDRGDYDQTDHVVMVVHGIGSVCDLRGRGLVDCVSDMRRTSTSMMKEHFPEHKGRVEYLPVCWHSSLHSHIDEYLSRITLPSVPRLRTFTNTTLVDVLCYSSPGFCESILISVATEMNRLRHLFASRCPDYDGSFSILGHSLGAMIAFDLVSLNGLSSTPSPLNTPVLDITTIPPLEFDLGHLFSLGSPISLFLTARGISFLGPDFRIETCKSIVNIFHPFDPVAYRLEPMLTNNYPPRAVIIPHHKGRKRLHLELKDNLVKVGNDIKSKLLQTLKITWSSLQEFASAHKVSSDGDWTDDDVLRVISKMDSNLDNSDDNVATTAETKTDVGILNGGQRVDYVLQEAPLESFNDYLFALGSHACYWESEDTVLKILKDIYGSLNISMTHIKLHTSNTQHVSANSPPNFPLRMPLNKGLHSNNKVLNIPTPTVFPRVQSIPPLMPVTLKSAQFLPLSMNNSSASIPSTQNLSGIMKPLSSFIETSPLKFQPSPMQKLPPLMPAMSTSTMVYPPSVIYPSNYLKETVQSNILPPQLPTIQNKTFFIPSSYEIESPHVSNDEQTLSSFESKPPILLDLPPPMSYQDMLQHSSLDTSSNSSNTLPSYYYQPFKAQLNISVPQPTQYSQPQPNVQRESCEVWDYFSPSSMTTNVHSATFKEHESQECVYDQNLESLNTIYHPYYPYSERRLTSEVNEHKEPLQNDESFNRQGECALYLSETLEKGPLDLPERESIKEDYQEQRASLSEIDIFGMYQNFQSKNYDLLESKVPILNEEFLSFSPAVMTGGYDHEGHCLESSFIADTSCGEFLDVNMYHQPAEDISQRYEERNHGQESSIKSGAPLMNAFEEYSQNLPETHFGDVSCGNSSFLDNKGALFARNEPPTYESRSSSVLKTSESFFDSKVNEESLIKTKSREKEMEQFSDTLTRATISSDFCDSDASRTSSRKPSVSNSRSSPMNVISMSNVSGSRPLVPQSGKLFSRKKK